MSSLSISKDEGNPGTTGNESIFIKNGKLFSLIVSNEYDECATI